MNVFCCIMVRTFTLDDSDSSCFKVKRCNDPFGESTWKDWEVSRGLIKHCFPSCLQKYFQRWDKLDGNCCQQGKTSYNWLELKTGKQKETLGSSSFSGLFSLAVTLEQHMQGSSGFESWDMHQWPSGGPWTFSLVLEPDVAVPILSSFFMNWAKHLASLGHKDPCGPVSQSSTMVHHWRN